MKNIFSLMMALLCILLLASCAAEKPHADVMQLTAYSSLDEFLAEGSAEYSEIRIPSSLPEDYKLYKITAGSDVAFWYLPEEYLTDKDTRTDAEAFQKHFMYIDSINASFDTFVKQLGGHPSNLVEDKYFITYTSSCMINWEEDGRLLSLYLPADMEVADGMIISNTVDKTSVTEIITLDGLCRTAQIRISGNE